MVLSGYNNVLLCILNKLIMCLCTLRCFFFQIKQIVNIKQTFEINSNAFANVQPKHLHLNVTPKHLHLNAFLENGICIRIGIK